ncbi:hypothetical protein [Brevibacterium sp. SMBL_HHYL_HB1]|jgi:hypothetical protein|uniref:hypothetical protein n=1 Tax=Brevibacterium sp. SMBL_HHYL_HB1 TaxID=2777556 RepID=UPI001BABB0F3|nr:hypothetical protein [Brevibacterium sp. SMBL_HHYL_HB1]QUL78076.1 hypothetical protein IG171_11345 [Brevibacterium sp. SMBL_HHYL_HB1]
MFFPDFAPSNWPVIDWPTTASNTSEAEAFEHAQAVSPLYLAVLSGLAFIIWWSLAMIARSKTGRISTKRLLVLLGMTVVVVTLGLLAGGGSMSPWIDVAIVTVGGGALLLLAFAVFTAMPISAGLALLLVMYRLATADLRKANNERRSEAVGALNKEEQS